MRRFVGNSGSVHVILTTDKYRQIADVTVQTRNQKLVARAKSTEMEIALRDALDKIEQQAIRHKKKKMTIKRHPKAERERWHGKVGRGGCAAPRRLRRRKGCREEQRRTQGGADAGAFVSIAFAAGGAARRALDRWAWRCGRCRWKRR